MGFASVCRYVLCSLNRTACFPIVTSSKVCAMKLLLAVIQPTKLNAVREALYQVGVERMTVCDAQGYGRQRGQTATYRGLEYRVSMLRKIALEIWVNEDFVERTIETLLRAARTGSEGTIGDGKVFMLPTLDAFSSDGSRGPGAV